MGIEVMSMGVIEGIKTDHEITQIIRMFLFLFTILLIIGIIIVN